MPQIPIIMPQLGESIAEAKVVNFLVKPCDTVEADQNLIEVETNKATMAVTSPSRGRLEKLTAQLNESYPVLCKYTDGGKSIRVSMFRILNGVCVS